MSTTGAATGTARTERPDGWTPRLVLSTTVMVLIIEASTLGFILVSVALPQITAHFQTTQGGWLITAYTLAGAVTCPLVGKVADIHGKRRVLLGCIVVSLAGALLAMVAPTYWVLILGRLLQGFVIPTMFLCYSLMRDVFPARILPLATSISMTGIGVFTMGSPFLIGWILDAFGFRGLFAVDALWLLLMLPLLVLSTPETTVRNRTRVDFFGAASLGTGLGVLLVGVSFGSTWGWASVATLTFLLVGVLLLAAFVARSLTYPEPIVDLRIFTRRGILLAAVTAGAAYSCSGMYGAMSALLAQTPREQGGDYGLGLSAFTYGYLVATGSLMIVVFGIVTGKLINRVGAAATMLTGLASTVASALVLAFAHDTFGQLLTVALLNGIGQGLAYASIPALVIAGSPVESQGSIAGMVQVSYTGMAAIMPVVLFVILASYGTHSSAAGVIYQGSAFQAGGIFSAAVAGVALLLGLTVLRVRREQGMIGEDAVGASSAAGVPAGGVAS